jgi:Na+/melibiose symporter-like transporter
VLHQTSSHQAGSTVFAGEEQAPSEAEIPELSLAQSLFYGTGGIAGGLVFTMMNNALPLYLGSYRMPTGLPGVFNPGGALPATIVALLTNERSLFGGLIQPMVGYLSDRTRSRIGKRSPYLLVGGLGTALAIGLLAIHPPFWLMILAITLAGMFLFFALGPYSALMADITPYTQRGRVGGLIAAGGVIGAIVFSLLSILLWEDSKGWVLVLTGAGAALSLIVVALGVHEPPSTLPVSAEDRRRTSDLFREMLRDRPLAIYTLTMGIYWLGAGAATPFITRFAVSELHISEANSFSLLLVIVLAALVGALIWGGLADKFGHKAVLRPALVLFSLAAFAGSQVQTEAQGLPVMMLVGFGNAAPTALYLPLLADLVPKRHAGAFMGFANMVWSVAQPIGSLAAGLLVDITGSYRGVFIFAAACMMAAAFLLGRVRPRA